MPLANFPPPTAHHVRLALTATASPRADTLLLYRSNRSSGPMAPTPTADCPHGDACSCGTTCAVSRLASHTRSRALLTTSPPYNSAAPRVAAPLLKYAPAASPSTSLHVSPLLPPSSSRADILIAIASHAGRTSAPAPTRVALATRRPSKETIPSGSVTKKVVLASAAAVETTVAALELRRPQRGEEGTTS